MNIKGLLATASNHLNLLDAYGLLRRKFTKSQVAILIYHRGCPDRDSWSLEPLSSQEFQKQIEYFCRNHELLSLDQLVSYIRQRKTLPEKAVVITLDDGYKDNYLYAYPILKKYSIPVTIFLTTGHIGSGNPLWDVQVLCVIQNTTIEELNLSGYGNYPLRSRRDKAKAVNM